MFRYILLSVLLFSGLFGADSFYQQTKINTSWKEQLNIKLAENNDSTYSISTSIEGAETSSGNLKVSDRDSAGSEAINGVFGESITETRVDDVSVQFQYNYFDERFDVKTPVLTGDGAATPADSMATVSSETNGTAMLSSRDSIRYKAGRSGYAFFTASFNGTGIGKAGCYDDEDGFVLEVNNGVASFGYVKSGVELGSNGDAGFDNQANWNGTYDVNNIDLTKVNIYMVMFGYLGVTNPTLWVKKDQWYPLHTIKTEGVLTETHVDTPVFPVSIYAENGMTVKSGSWSGGTFGKSGVASRGFTFPNTMVSGTGATSQSQVTVAANTTKTLVIFRSKALFNGKNNHVKAALSLYHFHLDIPLGTNTGVAIFQIVGVQTLSAAATYIDIDATSSVMEYDHTVATGASVSVATGIPIITENLEWSGLNKGGEAADATIDAAALGAIAYAGDVFAVVVKNIGGTDVIARVTLNWDEHF